MIDFSSVLPYLSIEGNIGSGKTTLATMLAEDLNATLILEQFTENPFLPEFYKDRTQYAFPVEVFFLAERHKQMESALQQKDIFSTFTISDYCFNKTAIFASQNLNEKEYNLFLRLYKQLEVSILQPGKIIYLLRPIPALLANISKRNRSFESLITADYLNEIQLAYLSYFNTIKHLPVRILHLGDQDFTQSLSLYQQIKSILFDKDTSPGVVEIHLT